MSAFEITSVVLPDSLLGRTRAAHAASVATAEQTAAAFAALDADLVQLHAALASLEAHDASGALDTRRELSILQGRRELQQKTSRLVVAARDVDRAERDQQRLADQVQKLSAELWKLEHDRDLLDDLASPEIQQMTIYVWHGEVAKNRQARQRLCGVPVHAHERAG